LAHTDQFCLSRTVYSSFGNRKQRPFLESNVRVQQLPKSNQPARDVTTSVDKAGADLAVLTQRLLDQLLLARSFHRGQQDRLFLVEVRSEFGLGRLLGLVPDIRLLERSSIRRRLPLTSQPGASREDQGVMVVV
jgi:hypothetical protein